MPVEASASKTEPVTRARAAVERWLRWSGLLPLPAFLLVHLGQELARAFPTDVRDVVRSAPGPFTLLAGVALVWLPLALHLGLGVWLLVTRRTLAEQRDDVPRLPRALSRWCAALAAAFVLYHARGYTAAVWLGEADPRDAGFRLVAELSSTRFGVPLSGAVYLLGLLATSTHAALGVHRALLAEGYLASAQRRRLSARLCTAFGVTSFATGTAAVIRVASGVLLR
jgi:succinate dehydrogenase/fumarate reductase cytochrome b subunit